MRKKVPGSHFAVCEMDRWTMSSSVFALHDPCSFISSFVQDSHSTHLEPRSLELAAKHNACLQLHTTYVVVVNDFMVHVQH